MLRKKRILALLLALVATITRIFSMAFAGPSMLISSFLLMIALPLLRIGGLISIIATRIISTFSLVAPLARPPPVAGSARTLTNRLQLTQRQIGQNSTSPI